MFDRLPTPWGLVRAGVAPDHPNIKAVSRVYEKTAEHPEFRFYGNVELGRDLAHDDLLAALPRGDLRGGRADRPPHGHPGRGPARQLGGHRVRGLVQRPPGLPRARVRPERGAGDRGGQRERRHGRRPDARAHARGARPDRRGRPRAGGARRVERPRDRGARPPRPRPGRVHEPRAARAGRHDRRRRVRRSRRRRARPALEGVHRERGRAHHREEERGHPAAATPRASRSASGAGSCCASSSRRSRSSAASAWRASASCATSWSRPTTARSAPAPTDITEELDCGLVFRSIGYRGTAHPGRALRRGALHDPERARPRSPARTRRVRGRLDQARPDGDHRHQQARRAGDGEPAARGPRRRPPRDAGRPRPRLAWRRCSPSASPTPSATPAGRPSTASSARPASRTAARA